jgi:hypothetical protein
MQPACFYLKCLVFVSTFYFFFSKYCTLAAIFHYKFSYRVTLYINLWTN